MNNTVLISVFHEMEIYSKCVLKNSFINNNNLISPNEININNINKHLTINEITKGYDLNKPAWFIFSYGDCELKEDISPVLINLDKDSIYTPMGIALFKKNDGSYLIEHRGQCEKKNRDGSNHRLIKSCISNTGATVDIINQQLLIIHSSLLLKLNDILKEKLNKNNYINDFFKKASKCIEIQARIINLKSCNWNQIDLRFDIHSYIDQCNYRKISQIEKIFTYQSNLLEEIKPKIISIENDADSRSSVYKVSSVSPDAINDSKSILFRYVSNGSTVLDVGSACGDLGVALHQHKSCSMYGMEYNSGSILISQATGAYKEVLETDLNSIPDHAHSDYFHKFDYIIFGDVLEHIYEPSEVLGKFLCYLKPEGKILISLPNLAHGSIKAGLLTDNFTYTENGLLDKTHIRFFTHQTIPSFLASNLLKIENFEVTSIGMWGSQPDDPFTKIPESIIDHIFTDPHSLVCQYIMELTYTPSISYKDCLEENSKLSIIGQSKNNFFIDHKKQVKLACSLLSKDIKNSNTYIQRIKKNPVFLMAPFSAKGCIYAPVFARYCKNIISAIDDYSNSRIIYGVPRWTSTELFKNISDYHDAVVIDFSSSERGKSWVLEICNQLDIDLIESEKIIDSLNIQ